MTRDEMLAELREVLGDSTGTVNWSTSRLLGLLSEGQDKFCEDTGFFSDLTSFTITLRTGVAVYDIPSRVIQVMDIWNGTTKLEKVLTGESQTGDYGYFPVTAGPPVLWRTDESTGFIKIYPTPTAVEDGTILPLQVWRYSKYDLAGDGAVPEFGPTPPAEPEIPSRLQRACVEWAAYKALSNHDEELQDKIKAADHLSNYRLYVSDGITALRRIQNMETRVGTCPAYRT